MHANMLRRHSGEKKEWDNEKNGNFRFWCKKEKY